MGGSGIPVRILGRVVKPDVINGRDMVMTLIRMGFCIGLVTKITVIS